METKKAKNSASAAKNLKAAKPLLWVPMAAAILLIAVMIAGLIVNATVGKEGGITFTALVGIFLMLALPLPCIAMAVIGLVLTVRARKAGLTGTTGFILLGVADLGVYSALIFMIVRALIQSAAGK